MIPQTIGRGLFAGKVYPSGDFTIGHVNKPPIATRDEDTHPLEGIHVVENELTGQTTVYFEDRSPQSRSYSLGLSDAINSHRISKQRARQGLTGITSTGKRMLRSGATILSQRIPRRLQSFLTITPPAMTEAENEIFNLDYPELVRQIEQAIKRALVRAGIKPEITYCVEVQEQRYLDSGLVPLHLHLVFQGRKDFRSGYAITPEQIDKIVKSQYERVLGRPVDVSASNTIETPRKSLDKELGKYISKGGKLIAKIIADGKGHLLPRSWWGMTTSLKRKVKAAIIKLSGEAASYFWDNINDLPVKYRAIHLGAEYNNKLVAKVGYMTNKDFIDEIRLLS